MHLLFITNSFYPEVDASGICVGRVIEQLTQSGETSVDILSYTGSKQEWKQQWNRNDSYKLYTPGLLKMGKVKSLFLQGHWGRGIRAIFEKSVRFFLKVWPSSYKALDIRWFSYCAFAKGYKKLLRQNRYDAIVTTVMPIEPALYLVRHEQNIPFYIYQLDTYWNNAQFSRGETSRKKELERILYQKSKAVFTTPIIQQINATEKIYTPQDTVLGLQFPMVVRLNPVSQEDIPYEDGYVNLVFVGALYTKIRKPDYLVALLHHLPASTRLYFVGSDAHQVQAVPEYQSVSDQIFILPPCPAQKAQAMVRAADVVVNIANDTTTQVPSKLFEYISSGKPILNIYSKKNCPTIPYMQSYPLGINIEADKRSLTDNAAQLDSFIKNNKGKQLAYEEVEPLFYDCTPKAVAQSIWNVVTKKGS